MWLDDLRLSERRFLGGFGGVFGGAAGRCEADVTRTLETGTDDSIVVVSVSRLGFVGCAGGGLRGSDAAKSREPCLIGLAMAGIPVGNASIGKRGM